MRAVVDIIVLLNIMGGVIGWLWRRHMKQKRNASLEHIKRLEIENKEIDKMMNRIKRGGD